MQTGAKHSFKRQHMWELEAGNLTACAKKVDQPYGINCQSVCQ